MSGDIGILLQRGTFAASLVGGGRRGLPADKPPLEGVWDIERPGELVIRLREHFGSVSRIALAVGLEFMRVAPVDLPPVGAVQRRAMLLLDPDRYFPNLLPGRYIAGLIDDPPLGALMEAELLERWVSLFGLWAPVQRVDVATVAAARAVPDKTVVATPVDIARGAAMGIDGTLDDALMPDSLADEVMVGRRRRLVGAGAVAMLALGLFLWSLNRSRSQLLDRLDTAIAAESTRAAPALALLDSAGASPRKRIAIDQLMGYSRAPLAVIADLSSRLPADVVLQSIESFGREWRIQGTATSGAAVILLLQEDDRFTNVRPLRAEAMVVEDGRNRQAFDIAFHALP